MEKYKVGDKVIFLDGSIYVVGEITSKGETIYSPNHWAHKCIIIEVSTDYGTDVFYDPIIICQYNEFSKGLYL